MVSWSASRESRGKPREAVHVDTCVRNATRERKKRLRATCTLARWLWVCPLYRGTRRARESSDNLSLDGNGFSYRNYGGRTIVR